MTKISAQRLERISKLAKLSLTDREREELGSDLERIIEFADLLSKVDVEGVPITTHAARMQNVFRPDERRASLDRDALLSNAPEHDGACFVVPKVLE